LEVSDHLETSVPGLFAAGDVVEGLDQISNAMGQAGVAATRIRNRLAEQVGLLR
jgi:thioredoxin reductase (NADPH)